MPPKPHKRASRYLSGTADVGIRRAILADEPKLRHWQAAATDHDTHGSQPELTRLPVEVTVGWIPATLTRIPLCRRWSLRGATKLLSSLLTEQERQ
jgi:hypothetical protein